MTWKIAIYETVHLDWIIPYAELLAEEDVSVNFITSTLFKNDLKSITALKNLRYTWHFLDPVDPFIDFSEKLYSALKSTRYDLVILNSIDSRHMIIYIVLMLTKPGRILINLHDINNFFKIKLSLNIRINIRSAGKKLLRHLAHGYIVNAEAMKMYMMKKNFTRKPIYWLQPVYYKPSSTNKKATFCHTIVIPGSIDQRRRDYRLVLEVIQEMLKRRVQVSWILAGKPEKKYGAEIVDKAKKLNMDGAKISFFKEEIPENEFQQMIAECSVILSPLISSTAIHDGITEIYGNSKGSGNVYDAIRHAKPLIIPAAVTVPEEIVTSCIRFQSKANLAEQIFKVLTDNSVFINYQEKAEENSKKITKEIIKKTFKEALLK